MSKSRLILGVLLCAGAVACWSAGAPRVGAPTPAEGEGRWSRVTAPAARLGLGARVIAARIVAPAVRKMVDDNNTHLRLVREDLRNARLTQTARNSAFSTVRQIVVMDSAALQGLEEGRPIDAFRQAMQAGGLVRALQGHVRTEGT